MIAVVQLDALSVPLVEQLLGEGRLPALAELRRRGRLLPMPAPATYFGDRETAHTGTSVTHHGQTFPLQWSASEQRLRPIDWFDSAEPIWERVARGGGRALVVDPYEGRRPRRDVGFAVSGWQFAHSAVLQRWTKPRREYPSLVRRYGRAPEVEDVYGRPSRRGLLRLRSQLLAAPERVARLVTDRLARSSHDLVWAELAAGHMAGHHFWDLRHLVGDELSEPERIDLERTVADTYVELDRALGEIVDALPAGTDVLVFSAVGMDVNRSRTDLLPAMLERVLGATAAADAPSAGSTIWRVRASVPSRARIAATRALPDRLVLELGARIFMHGVDWGRTRAFALPADHDGYVRFNVRDRERDGIVAADELDALADEIREGLMTFESPEGTPVVESVARTDELYGRGPRSDRLPDLVVRWSWTPTADVGVAISSRYGEVRRRGLGLGRSGNHVDGAWLLAVPGRGRRPSDRDEGQLVDVAATVAARLGVDEAGLTGNPLLERVS
ncbi:MAG TPA: alkaline phosphatase family protein [Gaiellaceae bacterium]|nr:alkaline phosphatase family protein [Gaiellaceae bacterium]